MQARVYSEIDRGKKACEKVNEKIVFFCISYISHRTTLSKNPNTRRCVYRKMKDERHLKTNSHENEKWPRIARPNWFRITLEICGPAPTGRRNRENRNLQSNSCMAGHASTRICETHTHTLSLEALINPPREKWAGESGVSSSPHPTRFRPGDDLSGVNIRRDNK